MPQYLKNKQTNNVCLSDFINCIQTVNQGQKIEYVVKVSGTKPITATWWRNGDTKLKSGKNSKIVFTQGEAKLLIMEAEATDDGEYKLECSNKFGSDSKLTRVTVIGKCFLRLFRSIFLAIYFFYETILCFKSDILCKLGFKYISVVYLIM